MPKKKTQCTREERRWNPACPGHQDRPRAQQTSGSAPSAKGRKKTGPWPFYAGDGWGGTNFPSPGPMGDKMDAAKAAMWGGKWGGVDSAEGDAKILHDRGMFPFAPGSGAHGTNWPKGVDKYDVFTPGIKAAGFGGKTRQDQILHPKDLISATAWNKMNRHAPQGRAYTAPFPLPPGMATGGGRSKYDDPYRTAAYKTGHGPATTNPYDLFKKGGTLDPKYGPWSGELKKIRKFHHAHGFSSWPGGGHSLPGGGGTMPTTPGDLIPDLPDFGDAVPGGGDFSVPTSPSDLVPGIDLPEIGGDIGLPEDGSGVAPGLPGGGDKLPGEGHNPIWDGPDIDVPDPGDIDIPVPNVPGIPGFPNIPAPGLPL